MKRWMSTLADVEKDFSLWANRDNCRSRIKSTWLNLIGVLILVGAVSYYFIFWQKSWSTPLITRLDGAGCGVYSRHAVLDRLLESL